MAWTDGNWRTDHSEESGEVDEATLEKATEGEKEKEPRWPKASITLIILCDGKLLVTSPADVKRCWLHGPLEVGCAGSWTTGKFACSRPGRVFITVAGLID